MKNIIVTLLEKTAPWVRIHAARLGERLRQHMSDTREYDEVMRRFQAVKPFDTEWVGGRRPTRDELYADRVRIR